MEVETLCFGGVFSAKGTGQLHRIKGTMDGVMSRQGQGIENGSWMGIPAWQWPKTQRPRQQRSGSRRSTLRSWNGLASPPNLNPIENLVEGAEGSSCQTSASNLNDLERICKEELDKIPPEMCANLVANDKKRLTSVITNNGFATKY